MNKLNRGLLDQVKKAFVSMPGGSDPAAGPGPVAGGGMLTQAQAAPMGDPSAMGGDPAAQGGMPPGGDPSMMGGMDPSMMGGDPAAQGGMPPGGDPAAMAGMDPSMMAPPAPPQGQITMSVPDLISLIQALGVGGGAKAKAPKTEGGAAPAGGGSNTSGLESKIDQLTQMLAGLGGPAGGGAAPMQ